MKHQIISFTLSRECLDLLKKTTDVLLADSSQQFDDILAQAAFLYWSMLNILSHLAIGGEVAEVSFSLDLSIHPSIHAGPVFTLTLKY